MFIGDAWYMAAWADELTDKPIFRRVCNQPIVLFRSFEGTAAALYDRCCHRGAPLSVGSVVDGGIQCGYHGLVFGSDGICVRIPGQNTIPATARVRSYPVIEKDQMIWIWMGDPEKANEGLVIQYPFHNDSARWPHRHGVYDVASSYFMLLDNLMDLTHLGYVHAKNVGGAANTLVEAEMTVTPTARGVEVKRWMPNCEPPPTYRRCVDLPPRVDRWQEFEFIAPCAVLQWNGAVGAVGTSIADEAGMPLGRAFLWEAGSMTNLGGLEGGTGPSNAYGINNAGQIVGRSFGPDEPPVNGERAILWESGQIYDLNDLIEATDPLSPYVTLFEAQAINDFGCRISSERTHPISCDWDHLIS